MHTSSRRHAATAAAVIALSVLGGCGGGGDGGTADSTATATGGGSSADGPTVDLALLAKLCPSFDAASKTYSHCKASTDASVNAVLIGINTWLAANSPTKKVAASPAPDASFGVAAGDTCSFAIEPGLGIWMLTLKGASGPNIAWSGTAIDSIQLNAAGVIVYMAASTDAAGAGFTNASGQMEINFPGTTGGKTSEVVYGKSSQFVSCTLK